MQSKALAKLIAKIINLYRASYVASAGMIVGTGKADPLQALLMGGIKAINKIPTPSPNVSKLFQNPEAIERLIRGMRTMK